MKQQINCLTTLVREELSLCGANLRAVENFDNNDLIKSSLGLPPDQQKVYLNRYWLTQLLTVKSENTIDVRFCLIDGGTPNDWLRLFKNMIIPCIIRNELPISIH